LQIVHSRECTALQENRHRVADTAARRTVRVRAARAHHAFRRCDAPTRSA